MTNSREQQGFPPRVIIAVPKEGSGFHKNGLWIIRSGEEEVTDTHNVETFISTSEHTALLAEAVREAFGAAEENFRTWAEVARGDGDMARAQNYEAAASRMRGMKNAAVSTEGGKGGE